VRQVIVTGVGDMLDWPKGALVNLVLRHVQRKVPHWVIPEAHSFRKVIAQGRDLRLLPVNLDRNDLAYLQYTGGTTGVAKGAMLTHGNMVANILQSRAWFQQVALERVSFVCALPLYHIFLADGELLAVRVAGRQRRDDRQSARFRRLRQGTEDGIADVLHGREHVVQLR